MQILRSAVMMAAVFFLGGCAAPVNSPKPVRGQNALQAYATYCKGQNAMLPRETVIVEGGLVHKCRGGYLLVKGMRETSAWVFFPSTRESDDMYQNARKEQIL